MKKFLADNITWLVLAALVLGIFAAYKILKSEGKLNFKKEEAAE